MGVLSEQLFRVGLLSKQQLCKQQAEEMLVEEQNQQTKFAQFAQKGAKGGFTELDQTTSMHEFKLVAKQLLLKNPSEIQVIIQKAHRFKNADQGKKFVWFFYQVRDILKRLSAEKREQFLNRAFRRSGSTLEIPNEISEEDSEG
ncbi:MAG: hypothetical protein V1686_00830 [Patescibacteria group bacterium]